MLYVTHALNFGLMIALPIMLGFFLARKFGVGWSLFAVGAVTFVASQVVHIPLNAGLTALFARNTLGVPAPPMAWKLPFHAVILGLTAGLCEESARYIVYRWWIKSARTWREALMLGAGHGGIEAIIFGALAGLAFLNLSVLRNVDITTLALSPAQQALAARQIADYWSAPWPLTLLGALERAFALCFHLSAAALVLQALTRRNPLWLGAAVLWHTALDAAAVHAVRTWGVYWTEALIGVFALASLGIILALRPHAPEPAPGPRPVIAGAPPSFAEHPGGAALAADTEADLRRQVEQTKYTS